MLHARCTHAWYRAGKYVQESTRFKSIKIEAGGNDASLLVDEVDLDATTAALRSAITAAKSLAPDVTIAAVPPRSQPAHALDNIHILNGAYKAVADEMSIRFAPNDEHFYFKNGSINEGYMYDSVHLTVKGANKLAESLGLSNIIDGQNAGVCSYRPSQAHCYDHESNKANNGDFNHAFWEVARGKVSRGTRNKRAHATTPMLNPHNAPSRDGVPVHQLPITQSTSRRPADPRHLRPKQPVREHYPTRSAPPGGNGRAHPSTQAGRPTYPRPQSRPQPPARPSQPGGTHGPNAGYQLTGRPLGLQQQGPVNLHSWRQRPHSALGQTNSPVTISYANSVKTNVDYCLYCGEANHRSASCRHVQFHVFHVVTKGTNHVYVIIIINMIIFNRGAAKKGRHHLHCVQCYLLLICHYVIRMKFHVCLTVMMPNLTNPRLVCLALLQVKPLITNKCKSNKDIILCKNDNIINHPSEVANVFNDYFTAIADGIGFNDPIPSGYANDAVLKTMIAKYDDHPSIIAIKKALPMGNSFTFTYVTVNET